MQFAPHPATSLSLQPPPLKYLDRSIVLYCAFYPHFLVHFDNQLLVPPNSVSPAMSTPISAPALSLEQKLAQIKSAHASPTQLQSSTREQLVFIATLINTAEGTKHNRPAVKKSGKVDELRQRIADYFSVHLPTSTASIPASAALGDAAQATPIAGINAGIRKAQWQSLRSLGRAEIEARVQGKYLCIAGECVASMLILKLLRQLSKMTVERLKPCKLNSALNRWSLLDTMSCRKGFKLLLIMVKDM